MTQDLDTPLEIALGVVEPVRDRYMDVIMTWIRLTAHWVVNDCDLGKVSVYILSMGCVGLHVVWIIYMC